MKKSKKKKFFIVLFEFIVLIEFIVLQVSVFY